MRCCIDCFQISSYPQPCFLYEKNQLQDATNLTRNSSRHQIKDFARGLLAVLVETANRLTKTDFHYVAEIFSFPESQNKLTLLISSTVKLRHQQA